MQENDLAHGGARPKKPSGKPHSNKPRSDGDHDRKALSNLTADGFRKNKGHNFGKKDTGNKNSSGKKNQNKTAEFIALTTLLPDRYKKCIVQIDDKGLVYAKVTGSTTSQDNTTRISIHGMENRGHCFPDDEVVVEILKQQNKMSEQADDDNGITLSDDITPVGKVIGIIQSANNLDDWIILCTADENNSDLLRPIDRSLPTLSAYKDAESKGLTGHVALFKYTSHKKISFLNYHPVVLNVPKIFCVRYLWWNKHAPLGVVVGVLPDEEPLKRSMRILGLENRNPGNFPSDVCKEIDDSFPGNFEISCTELSTRLDLTGAMTFTIDPPESKDFDDALSVTELTDGKNCVGVHIADVAYFVKPKTLLDKESRKRGTSIYEVGGKEPISMLPERLSADLCSLQEGKNRLALSVFMTTDANDNIVTVELRKTVIKSQFRLNYNQVQEVIVKSPLSSSGLPNELQKVLILLNRISQQWRKRRVGHIEFSRQTNNLDYVLTPIAHRIVEEMMITANHQVARLLVDPFSKSTPLVIHRVPDKPEIADWRRRFPNETAIIEMVQPLHEKDNLVGSAVVDDIIDKNKKFVIHKQVWREMAERIKTGELERLQSLILSPEYHPGLIVAWFNLPSFTKRSAYVCSGDHVPDNRWHFTLNLPCYTQFTSPIRRYIDLVVHRLVHSYIDDPRGTPPSYGQSEISELCQENQSIKTRVGIYESNAKNVHFGEFLRVKPLTIHALVERVTSTGLKLNCLQLSAYLKLWPIDVSHLGAKQVTAVRNHRRGKVILAYTMRIYDLDSLDGAGSQSSQDHEGPVKLSSRRNVFYASIISWKELVLSALEGDRDKIMSSMDAVVKSLEDPESVMSSGFNGDVTCEGIVLRSGKCAVDFTTAVTAGDIIQVQVAGESTRGKLSPFVQLLSLSPTVDVCLEHRTNPGKCFAQLPVIQNSAKGGIEAYCKSWSSLVVMEAVENAVARSDCFLVRNVGVTWLSGEGGYFQISVEFCRDRSLGIFNELVEEKDPDEDLVESGFLGLMCLRYHGVVKPPPGTELPIGNVIDLDAPFTWIAHCVATDITKTGNDFTVYFNLKQSSTSIPEQIIHDFKSHKATLEWTSISQSERNTVKILRNLSDMYASSFATSFASSSAQSHEIRNLDREHFSIVRKNLDKIKSKIKGRFNKEQENLILDSLQRPFSLIHGFTSSGKTLIAAQLAFRIAQVNKINSSARGQVMCCGPTETCLLSLAELLHSAALGLSVVLVYDRHEERKDFPLPEDLSFKSRSLVDEGNELRRSLGLHHLVRKTESPDGDFIRQMDTAIITQPMDVSYSDLLKYKAAIEEEEVMMITKADVILCLCATSVEKRLRKNANIKQVIIDDSQACSEPETLLPLVHGSVCQVILCGDVKQLKPTIISSVARKNGLGLSLFERCLDESTVLLTKQYSMHHALLNLLSPVFYDDQTLRRNQVNEDQQSCLDFWPCGTSKPFLFLDIVGTETLSPYVCDGNVPDFFNKDEVKAVVQICNWLVQKISSQESVAVLSFYEMQRLKMKKQLKGLSNVTVEAMNSTLGCHWNYVIISSVRSLPLSDIKQKPDKKWLHSSLGCLCSKNICCSLLSRAYDGLIIIGNETLLQCDDSWKQLLQYCRKNRSVVDCREFLANHLK